ncbi:GNAT family N-acetyltransferase [Roseomonas populi]|uniref:GNAT family N-acetyltransferase n=1 Tax=Roseomonas populi TaxID=3121582 RepID=UPI0038CD578D
MQPVLIDLPRFLLRDFHHDDRDAFIGYQNDPRYLRLYDFNPQDSERASRLFDLFMTWQDEDPRTNIQLGIFDRRSGRLCGSAGLRKSDSDVAVLGIELAPSEWGRFRLALDVVAALLDYGFGTLQLTAIVGDTASGNKRVEKLARWFGARVVAQRPGPAWMQVRGWQEVDWALGRTEWTEASRRFRSCS